MNAPGREAVQRQKRGCFLMHVHEKYSVPLFVLWLAGIGLFIRIWGLWQYAFSPDELTVPLVPTAGSLHQVLTAFKGETNAPLTYVIIYFLLNFSNDELVLRCMSLIPGSALIIMFFFLGRKVSGPASGLAMAYLAAFSMPAILMSEVIRQYSVLLFFLTVALWFLISYFDTWQKKYLYGYSLFIALSISTLYASVIPLAAIVMVWLTHSIIQKKPAKEFANIIIFNLLPFIIFGALYFYHISFHTEGGGVYSTLKQTYLATLFPNTLKDFFQHTYDLFWFLFLPPYAIWLMVLAGAGVISLWRSSHRSLLLIIVGTFTINYAFAYFKKYPFGGTRHSIYIFPLIAVLIGAAVQQAYNFFMNDVLLFIAKRTSRRVEYLQITLFYLGITCLFISTLVITFTYEQSDFLRLSKYTLRFHEFPLKRDNQRKVFTYLTEKMGPEDIILANFKTSYYFIYYQLPNQTHITYPSSYCRKFSWNGFNCFDNATRYGFDEMGTVVRALQCIHQEADLKKVSKIWLVNMGWETDEIEALLLKNPQYRFLFHKELSVEGGCIHSLKAQDVMQNVLESRSQNIL